MNKKLLFIPISAAVICAVLASCSNPQDDLKRAEQINTEQAYQDFIQKHPGSPLVAQAQADMENVVYQAAKQNATSDGFEDFLKRFPKSPLAPQAEADLENVEYHQATVTGTADAYEEFLNRFPNRKHASEAKAALENVEFASASSDASITGWRAFLTKYPNSQYGEAAYSNLSELSFKAAVDTNTANEWESFLNEFPASGHRPEANERLALLVWRDVGSTNTISAYESFITRFGGTSVATQASNALAKLEYQAATNNNTIEGYEAFLRKCPDSTLAEDVKRRLESQLEDRDWNQTLLQNTIQAYLEFHKSHPDSKRIQVFVGTVRGRYWYKLSLPFQANPTHEDGVLVTVKGSDALINLPLQDAKLMDVISSGTPTSANYQTQGSTFNYVFFECDHGGIIVGNDLIEPKDSPNSTLILSQDGTRILSCDLGKEENQLEPDPNPTFIEQYTNMSPFNEINN